MRAQANTSQCDEAKPSCGACNKKGRPCTYNDQSFVEPGTSVLRIKVARSQDGGLSLIGSREIGNGGSIQTWTLETSHDSAPDSSDLSRPLMSPSMKLVRRWLDIVEVTSSKGSPFELFDVFLQNVPKRIGTHPAVDTAVSNKSERSDLAPVGSSLTCSLGQLLSGMLARICHEEHDRSRPRCSTRAQSISVLRKSLAKVSPKDEDSVLVSIMLHFVAEVRTLYFHRQYSIH